MKLQAQVHENTYPVEITRNGVRVTAKIDGREYDLEVSEPEPNVFLFKENGKIHEFFVSPETAFGSPTIVSSNRGDVEVTLIDPKRLRGSTAVTGSADGLAEVKTMMPGKVVRLIHQKGDEVAKGDSVIVVEAMKMQNDLKSPKAGVVKEIRVEDGATVSAGEVLAIIE
jgi:biotin carboxyl carrier protein